MVKPHELITAYYDNVRSNQIGGETDGIDPKVMADTGFETAEETLKIISNLGNTATSTEKPVTFCGDCGKPLPCDHSNGKRTFGY